MTQDFQQAARALAAAGRELYALGMVPATSGNFSARLDAEHIAITVSGRHKGRLTADDIMVIDYSGQSLDDRRPSAETLLHTQIYQRFPAAGAILHPHSLHATLLSKLLPSGPVATLELQDYELLKAFTGVTTHAAALTVPVFDNDQDIARLVAAIDEWMAVHPPIHGYIIRGHGFYTWGEHVDDTLRHVEAFDFLFKCELTLRGVAIA
ncbi:MAG: methylthioribulose 1-phosphate dehydratase [Gammaproteobacteria bacterium]